MTRSKMTAKEIRAVKTALIKEHRPLFQRIRKVIDKLDIMLRNRREALVRPQTSIPEPEGLEGRVIMMRKHLYAVKPDSPHALAPTPKEMEEQEKLWKEERAYWDEHDRLGVWWKNRFERISGLRDKAVDRFLRQVFAKSGSVTEDDVERVVKKGRTATHGDGYISHKAILRWDSGS